MNAWTPVQVTNEKLARHGEAGTVQALHADGTVDVRFDVDGEVENLKVSDLRAL